MSIIKIVSPVSLHGGAKVQVTGHRSQVRSQVTGHRPQVRLQVRLQATGHRPQVRSQVTQKSNRTLDKTVLD